jgi:hypothetical protein
MFLSHFRSSTAWRAGLGAAALAVAVVATPGGASAASLPPTPTTCPPVRVTAVEVERTVDGPGVRVTGLAPHADTRLHLVAEDVVYVQQPDYWQYFVLGCDGTGPVVKTRFSQVFPLSGPVGRYGIQVHGHTVNLGVEAPSTDA